ncbi:MAG: hypothetical protein U1E17_11340 [Geminicoccaceae bacterium]
MMAQHRSTLPFLVLALGVGALIWAATSRPLPTSLPAAPAATLTPGICVTPSGLCNAPAAPTRQPCSCPNPLRGTVWGHIERVDNPPAALDDHDAPLRDEDQWGRVAGP